MVITKTMTSQHTLPRLPIPPLNSTKYKLVEWIRPLVDDKQFQKTEAVINRFFKESGEAVKLQEKLYDWDQNQSGSWLTPFWEDAYLNHRDSLPASMNFNVLLKETQNKNEHTVFDTVGEVSYLMTEQYHELIDEKNEPDMSQLNKLFRSVRIPEVNRDAFYVADFDKKNNHVVLLYKNNVYKVPVTNDEGVIYNSLDITVAIETALINEVEEGKNVGIFTTAKRDQAAQVYSELKQSHVNAKTLQVIADALVVISIDENSKDSEAAIKNLMLSGENKYFDKTIQIIVTQYGALGFNMEHSAIDGTSVASVISHVSKGLERDLTQINHVLEKPSVEKMTWELSKTVKEQLSQFEKDQLKRKANYSLYPNNFTSFGAETIKGLKLSPDAFFHMALQLAQYRTYGEFKSVYEPVSVRSFQEGRTESARATSVEKRNLVEAIESGAYSEDMLYKLMQTASNAHTDRIQGCQQGLGVERHLHGLKQMYHLYGAELGMDAIPELFIDEGYITLSHDFISTSGMAYENAKYRMFAPVVENGHGVAYFLLEDLISVNISSFKENQNEGNQLMHQMVNALIELREIAEQAMKCKVSS